MRRARTAPASTASVAIAVAVVWLIAIGVATIIAYATAWPVALFVGGSPVTGWGVGFVAGGIVLGIWATRTTGALLAAHRARDDVFRRPWPPHARRAELGAAGVLDRRGQPWKGVAVAGDVLGDLRGGERTQRAFTMGDSARVHLALDGPPDAVASILDVDQHSQLDVTGVRRHAAARIGPGSFRVVIQRSGPDDGGRAAVQAWWVADTRGTT